MSFTAVPDRHLVLHPCWVIWICIACAQAAHAGEVGQLAPRLLLPVLNPSSVSTDRSFAPAGLQDLAGFEGKVVYLDFWDSFCKPCRDSLPLLSVLQERLRRSDVRIYSVNLDADPRRAASFLARHPVSFPVTSDPSAISAQRYGLTALPMAFFVGRDGRVAGVHRGFRQGDLEIIEQKLLTLAAAGIE